MVSAAETPRQGPDRHIPAYIEPYQGTSPFAYGAFGDALPLTTHPTRDEDPGDDPTIVWQNTPKGIYETKCLIFRELWAAIKDRNIHRVKLMIDTDRLISPNAVNKDGGTPLL